MTGALTREPLALRATKGNNGPVGADTMDAVAAARRDLVTANRILAHERVLDGYGHVSVRHPARPDRFFLSRSRSAELVEPDDLMEFGLDGMPVDPQGRTIYVETPIHAAILRARPEVACVVHNHAYEVIPFSTTNVPIRPLASFAGGIGAKVPVWDIRDRFGDTTMMVVNMEQGDDLAAALDDNVAALLRGHGAVVTGRSVKQAVLSSIYLMVNARLQLDAMRMGAEARFLSDGEIALTSAVQAASSGTDRLWEYLTIRSGYKD